MNFRGLPMGFWDFRGAFSKFEEHFSGFRGFQERYRMSQGYFKGFLRVSGHFKEDGVLEVDLAEFQGCNMKVLGAFQGHSNASKERVTDDFTGLRKRSKELPEVP